jgi:hypothetical protein
MVSGRYSLEHAADALHAVEARTALKALIVPNGNTATSGVFAEN